MKRYVIALLCLVSTFLWAFPEKMSAIEEIADVETTDVENRDTVDEKSGLVKNEDGSFSYYKEGEPLRNTLKKVTVDGEAYYYYFRSGGRALTNSWKTIDGYRYYFGKRGRAYTGKRKIGEDIYFFSEKGRRQSGWKTIDDKTYYFSEKNGKMLTGKQQVSHYLCYFNKKGVLTRRIDKNKKMVALTYDDGPSVYTSQILDVLEEQNAVATFFVVGNRVSRYSDTVKRAQSLGCEIGNHTYEHKNLTKLDTKEIASQITRTDEAVKKACGVTPVIARAPGGSLNAAVKASVGKPLIQWSLDTIDWKTRDTGKTQSAVLDHVKDGDIILMHDIHLPTVNAAERIVTTLLERGYQLVTVSELAECRGELKEGVSYSQFRP